MKRDFFNENNATKRQRRLLEIDQCLRKSRMGMTKAAILKHLESQDLKSSLRSFWRDIEHLRDLGAPINHDAYINTVTGDKEERWFYNDPAWTFSQMPMTEGTLFALLVSQRVMRQFAGLPMAKNSSVPSTRSPTHSTERSPCNMIRSSRSAFLRRNRFLWIR